MCGLNPSTQAYCKGFRSECFLYIDISYTSVAMLIQALHSYQEMKA